MDTSVWSLAFRRHAPSPTPEVGELARALRGGDAVVTTGLVLQELLQGFAGPQAYEDILTRFSALPFLVPDRGDHIEAAKLRNVCRRGGVQIATIDALLAQLCIHHALTLLTTDRDFQGIARHSPLRLWGGAGEPP